MLRLNKENTSSYYYGHGKILLTGEYGVLDGALALALPTNFGQSMSVKYSSSYDPKLHWKSYDSNGKLWFDATYELWHFNCLNEDPKPEYLILSNILKQAREQNPHFLREDDAVHVETRLEFPVDWGLGSSSTLIYNIAQWAYVSPFELQFKTLGGSGYDIACAQSMGPISYEKRQQGPVWSTLHYDPTFKDNLYFVYTGRKQDTRDGIDHYRKKVENQQELAIKLSHLTKDFIKCENLTDFEFLLNGHEKIVSQTLDLPMIKELMFSDYWGAVKSLGAWGGDFVLVTSNRSEKETREYFASKNLIDFIPYRDMVLTPQKKTLNSNELLH